MPLKFLSNTADDFFILENRQNFRLKPDVAPWWALASFRALCQDRIRFALKRYFHRRSKSSVPVTAVPSNLTPPLAPDEAKSPRVLVVPHHAVKGREFKTALPLVGYLAAGPLAHGFSVESLGNLEEVDWVEVPQRFAGPNRFAVRVGGKSMEPTLSLGDIVIVEYHRRPRRSGQVVVAMGAPNDAAGQAVEAIKRLVETKEAWVFKSDNADYPGFSIQKEVTDYPILGVVLYNLTIGAVVK